MDNVWNGDGNVTPGSKVGQEAVELWSGGKGIDCVQDAMKGMAKPGCENSLGSWEAVGPRKRRRRPFHLGLLLRCY